MMEYEPGAELAAAAGTGDYVGVESCIDLRNEEEFEAYARDCERRCYERRMRRRMDGGGRRRRDQFPPPITSLARTENQPSHMPWVMKRYYTDDGRLVIREEKVRHHEYFRAHRAGGRLTLQLIPLDSDTLDDHTQAVNDVEFSNNVDNTEVVNDEEEEEAKQIVPQDGDDADNMEVVNEKGEEEEVVARVTVTSVSMAALCITEGVKSAGMLTSASSSSLVGIGAGGGGKKCYGFNSLRSSSASSLFHLQVPAIRPVIS